MEHIIQIDYVDRKEGDPPMTGLQVTRTIRIQGGSRVAAILSAVQDADELTRENIMAVRIVHPLDES